MIGKVVRIHLLLLIFIIIMTNLKPLGSRILVKPEKIESKTMAGIFIPDTVVAGEKSTRGVVVKVGPGTPHEPMTVKEGDVVIYGKHAGTEVQSDNESYLLMKVTDIYAIIE
jgi:chaperonin GroES